MSFDFFNHLSAILRIELTEPPVRIVEHLQNERAQPAAQILSLHLEPSVFENDELRPLSEQEFARIAFDKPEIRLRGLTDHVGCPSRAQCGELLRSRLTFAVSPSLFGYLIHMGVTKKAAPVAPLVRTSNRPARVLMLTLAGTSCSDPKGGLTAHCLDPAKEQALLHESQAANAFALKKVAPYRAALRAALREPPHTGSTPCALVAGKDWQKVAETFSLGAYIDPGLTFLPFDYQGAAAPLEEISPPSRVRAAGATYTVRSPGDGVFKLDFTCPDYARETAHWKSMSEDAFWTYEVVVVDDGPTRSSATSSGGDAGEESVTRRARAFVYDYATKKIACFGNVEVPADNGYADMQRPLISGAIAALRTVD